MIVAGRLLCRICIIVHDKSPLIIHCARQRPFINPETRGCLENWGSKSGMTQSGTRRLRLLGTARVDQIQKAHNKAGENDLPAVPRFRSRRTVGLLGYLSAKRRPVAREHLAALFWPDEAQSKARANLSRELHNLAQILPDCWELDRRVVAFVLSADTTVDLYTLLELQAE